MLLEIENIPKDVSLYKWYRVRSYDHEHCQRLYIRFIHAWDMNGNKLDKLPAGAHVITEAHFEDNPYA